MTKLCCTPTAPCRRCHLWEETSAHAPVTELRPCALCEEPWADLAPGTGLCPACRIEIAERQEAESRSSGSPEGIEEERRRVQERRREEFEQARRKLRRLEALGFTRKKKVAK